MQVTSLQCLQCTLVGCSIACHQDITNIFDHPRYVGDSNSSEADSAVGESDNEGEVVSGHTGWADAMSRVLKSKKPRKSRAVILSRAKKLNEGAITVKEEDTGLEVGDVKPKISSVNEQHSRRKVSIVYT